MSGTTASEEILVPGLTSLGSHLLTLPLLIDLLGAASVFVLNLTTSQPLPDLQELGLQPNTDVAASSFSDAIWPGAFGNILFNDNVVTVSARDTTVGNRRAAEYLSARGTSAGTTFNVALIGFDDIGADSNRISCVEPNDLLLANLFTSAMTVRATGNRLQEPNSGPSIFSALTVGYVANTTALNQADNCIADVIAFAGFNDSGRPGIKQTASPPLDLQLKLNIEKLHAINADVACHDRRQRFISLGMEYIQHLYMDNAADGSNEFTSVADAIRAIEVKGIEFVLYQMFGWTEPQPGSADIIKAFANNDLLKAMRGVQKG